MKKNVTTTASMDCQVDGARAHGSLVPAHHGVQPAEVAELLDDLKRVGAKASGEMIGICSQAGAVIQALLPDALDAARYRWLRDQDWLKTGLVKTTCGGMSTFQYVGKGLDAAIDLERRKS